MVQNWTNKNETNYKKIREEQDKLINDNSAKKKNLNNINLELKPGLILDSILSGKSLILKYLSNLPTVVLERFNELIYLGE